MKPKKLSVHASLPLRGLGFRGRFRGRIVPFETFSIRRLARFRVRLSR